MIRLAISKGRILEQAIQILHNNNINCKLDPLDTRKLIIPTNMNNNTNNNLNFSDKALVAKYLSANPFIISSFELRRPEDIF